jgi:hypothetical protein
MVVSPGILKEVRGQETGDRDKAGKQETQEDRKERKGGGNPVNPEKSCNPVKNGCLVFILTPVS